MKKNISYFTLFCFLIFIAACAPKVISQLNWQDTPVTIDGKLTEWQPPLRFYDVDTKLNYVISNDKENLYICIRAADEKSQLKILRGGMQIWIDTTGKKKKQIGINFPLTPKQRINDDDPSAEFKKEEKPNMDKLRKKLVDESNEMYLTGFKSPLIGLNPRQNTSGLNISVNWDANNIMIYEAVIPFSTFYKPTLSPTDNLKVFGFSIVVNGLNAPERKDNNTSGGTAGMPGGGGMGNGGMGGAGGRSGMGGTGMGGSGMGQMGGGGMGGRGGGGMNNATPSNPMYETNSFWVKIRLASK